MDMLEKDTETIREEFQGMVISTHSQISIQKSDTVDEGSDLFEDFETQESDTGDPVSEQGHRRQVMATTSRPTNNVLLELDSTSRKLKETEEANRELLLKVEDLENELKALNEKYYDEERNPSVQETCKVNGRNLENELQELTEKYEQQRNGFIEELNKMNVALKQRGEMITKLEEQSQISINNLEVELETLQQLLVEKERRIEHLEQEMKGNESQSEVMSTSTVSKAEEIHRMKDVEDSLEDRYNKLKMLALKMKKKMADQSSQVDDMNLKLAAITKEKINANISIQALQKDIDRLNDELDAKKSNLKVLKHDFENVVQELAKSKEIAENHRLDAITAVNSFMSCEDAKNALDKSLQEAKNKVAALTLQSDSERIMRKEIESECESLKKEVAVLNSTIAELNRNQEEFKKHKHLLLEISDYEKTVAELNAKVTASQQQSDAQQVSTNNLKSCNEALVAQVRLLEEQISTEQSRSDQLKMALDGANQEMARTVEQEKKLLLQIQELNSKSLSNDGEIEDVRLQLSLVSGNLQKSQHASAAQLESMRKQAAALESRLETEQKEKDILGSQLLQLQDEFENYKIRAASVLKKQKTEGSAAYIAQPSNDINSSTEQVERDMLQRLVDAFKVKTADLESQLSCAQNEITNLRTDKERLASLEKKNKCLMEQQLELATQEMDKARREFETAIERFKRDNELLSSLHREHVDSLKVRHGQEVATLQNELDLAGSEIMRLQLLASKSRLSISPHTRDPVHEEVAIMEREQGEGSEDINFGVQSLSIESNSRKPIPLDELLNSSLAPEDSSAASPVVRDQMSLDQSREQLLLSDKRCRHLAALLAESEANEARLSQLTDALKEEIRRNERAEERQKHVENLEYLKNIVFKFLSLPRGEERSRLVPVLTTILRLSPAEVQQLNQSLGRTFDSSIRPSAWGGVFNLWSPSQ